MRYMTPIFHTVTKQVLSQVYMPRTSDLNLLSFVRISGRLCRMVQKRSTLPIGWESLLSNLLGKPVSGIPLVLSKAETTSFVEHSRNGCQDNECLTRLCWSDLLSSPTSSSLAVHRNLFPYVDKIFHPKILKFLGRALPWPKLNHLMDLAETMNSKSRGIYETK